MDAKLNTLKATNSKLNATNLKLFSSDKISGKDPIFKPSDWITSLAHILNFFTWTIAKHSKHTITLGQLL